LATRLGIDVGGTFTDLVFFNDETGEVVIGKGPTTPEAQDEGILDLLRDSVPAEELRGAHYFLHGTTVGINALLQRKGAVVGLLTTAGFRDLLEIRRGDRAAMYDVLWATPEPLVPRHLRLPVHERVMADGTVETPIALDDVRAALEIFSSEGVDAVGIVFLNSYANPEHELAAAEALRDAGFQGDISLSHVISGEFHEYERTSTTVVDAFIRPKMSVYLRRLENSLREGGFGGQCLITRSGGGAVTFREGEERAFETIQSGPAAGAVGAEVLCQQLGLDRAVTADVGGTSFDTALIYNGRAAVRYQGAVEGMPLQAPWIDVRSIGAGGGSLAYIDAGGLLRVGPQSAGAVPGPISYRRGGTQPTVTDAAAALGMLGDGTLAGGLTLDIEGARRGLEELGRPLGRDVEGVAAGVLSIANAAMAQAIRSVTIEQGEDPREATLVAFGGAGPLFACLLARELDMRDVVVPRHAGNFSAWGLLGQDVVREAARTYVATLDDDGIRTAVEVIEQLRATVRERAAADSADDATVEEIAFDLRYVGQEHTLTVPAPSGSNGKIAPTPLRDAFTSSYQRSFGYLLSEPVEIVTVRVALRVRLPQPEGTLPPGDHSSPVEIDAYSFRRGARIPFTLIARDRLATEPLTVGPAVITEPTATTYVDDGFTIVVGKDGTLKLHDTEAGK
jgi:N-methylhydantoinase A